MPRFPASALCSSAMIGVIVPRWMVMALGLQESRVTVAVEAHHESPNGSVAPSC